MDTKLDATRVAEAHQLLKHAQRIVIFSHMAPDGDAVGSSLAVWHWLKQTRTDNPSVSVILPNAFPSFLEWLPGAGQIVVYEANPAAADRLIAEADLHVCLDFNEPKRVGPVGDRLVGNPCPKLLVDHHIMAGSEWLEANPESHVFSFPSASSTCELVYRFFAHIDEPASVFSADIAACLYTGLMTDTGNFSYNSNQADLYEMVAVLVRAGIDKDAIYNAVFNQFTADRLRLVGYCLHRKMRLFPEYHLAVIPLSHAELREFRFQSGDTEGIVNMPLQISDVYYSVFLREEPAKPGTPSSRIKLSFRSQGDRPVNVLAAEIFRGGGHMNAAGGEFFGSLNAALQRLIANYPDYLKKN